MPAQPSAEKIQAAPADPREAARLDALHRYDILDTPREESFDRIARLIRNIFGVQIAVVSLIDAHRQWMKAADGLDVSEVGLDETFCRHAMRQDMPLIVDDAQHDARFSAHPMVTGEPNIRAYAGVTMRNAEGFKLGTVCAIDDKPRRFDGREIAILTDLARIAMEQIELRAIAGTDALTGLPSRRGFRDQAERARSLALRHGHPLSCIAFDVDHFKSVNDTHGHAVGDRVLACIGDVCRKILRKTDIAGRTGGEEFAVMLPHTAIAGALDVAEKLRAEIALRRFDTGRVNFGVTASFGIVQSGDHGDLDHLLADADAALYEAKAGGRNRCVARRPATRAVQNPRRRVLKAGRIILNHRHSTVDCTVRWLSDGGAGLDVVNAADIPDTFTLGIPSDRFETRCRIAAQTDRHIEVEFC